MNFEKWKEVKLGDIVNINIKNISKNFKFREINYYDISSVKSGEINKPTIINIKEIPSRAKKTTRKRKYNHFNSKTS